MCNHCFIFIDKLGQSNCPPLIWVSEAAGFSAGGVFWAEKPIFEVRLHLKKIIRTAIAYGNLDEEKCEYKQLKKKS